MEAKSLREALIPPEMQENDIFSLYSYALQEYSKSIVHQKKTSEEAKKASKDRKEFQELVEELKIEFEAELSGTNGHIPPSTHTPHVEEKQTAKQPEESPRNPQNEDTQVVSTPINSDAKPSGNDSSPAGATKSKTVYNAFDEIDNILITEDFYAYNNLTDGGEKAKLRSVLKDERDAKRIIGLPFYAPAATIEKTAKKHVFNALPRFFENENPINPLKPKYQLKLDEKVSSRNLKPAEEILAMGGKLENDGR